MIKGLSLCDRLLPVLPEQVIDRLRQQDLNPAVIDSQQFELPMRRDAERDGGLLLAGSGGSVKALSA